MSSHLRRPDELCLSLGADLWSEPSTPWREWRGTILGPTYADDGSWVDFSVQLGVVDAKVRDLSDGVLVPSPALMHLEIDHLEDRRLGAAFHDLVVDRAVDSDHEFGTAVFETYEDQMLMDRLLWVEKVEVDQQWRGHGIGAWAFARIVQEFGGTGTLVFTCAEGAPGDEIAARRLRTWCERRLGLIPVRSGSATFAAHTGLINEALEAALEWGPALTE